MGRQTGREGILYIPGDPSIYHALCYLYLFYRFLLSGFGKQDWMKEGADRIDNTMHGICILDRLQYTAYHAQCAARHIQHPVQYVHVIIRPTTV